MWRAFLGRRHKPNVGVAGPLNSGGAPAQQRKRQRKERLQRRQTLKSDGQTNMYNVPGATPRPKSGAGRNIYILFGPHQSRVARLTLYTPVMVLINNINV